RSPRVRPTRRRSSARSSPTDPRSRTGLTSFIGRCEAPSRRHAMRMDGQDESSNVEDVRGMRGGGDAPTQQSVPQGPAPAPPSNDAEARFVSQVLRSTEVVWTDVFRQAGRTYQPPRLVLFSDRWPTACGQGQAAMGPFYCPNDQKVYIDL